MPEPSSGSPPARFFIHAGLPKTGTTYLQDALFASREALAEQGLALVPERRHGHFNLALQVRGQLRDFDPPAAHRALETFTHEASANAAPRALLTHEVLAPTTVEQLPVLLGPLAGYDVHLLITVRDLGRQVPSAWQQRIQGRGTDTFEDYLDAVQHRGPAAADFWRNQDLADVLARWSTVIAPEQIHVITCPPAGAPHGLLLERFCSVLGIDPATLAEARPAANAALGHAQAELLRRVNVELGDRLPHSRSGYRRVGKTYLSGKILRPQGGTRPALPSSMRPWVDKVTNEWVDLLSTGAFDVVGDLDELRSEDSAYADERVTSTDSELLDAAAAALAEVLVMRDKELDERTEERARLAELEREAGQSPEGGLVRRLRRRLRS
jgi:hypothetical protein